MRVFRCGPAIDSIPVDIYRYFHPHHNPRLHSTALRQQELSELEQAAAELMKAVERAQQRCGRNPSPPIMPEHFTDLLKALKFLVNSFQTLCDAHQGDTRTEILALISERSELSGWESWVSLVREQLASDLWEHSNKAVSGASVPADNVAGQNESSHRLKFGT